MLVNIRRVVGRVGSWLMLLMLQAQHTGLRLPEIKQLYGAIAKAGHSIVIARAQAEHTALHLGQVVVEHLLVHVPDANARRVAGAEEHLVGLVPFGDKACLDI